MKFAVNYSTHLEALVREGQVNIDLVKCPEWGGLLSAARSLCPVCVHFDINVGVGHVEDVDFDLVREILGTTATPHINCHLTAAPTLNYRVRTDRQILLNNWVCELEYLQSAFPDVPVAAENLPYHESAHELRLASDPELITKAIQETGAYLLLDLSHARITSDKLGIDYQSYIARLPVERIRELHITGLKTYHGSLIDHFELSENDWEPTRWAREQISSGAWSKPEVVAFEYGGIGDAFTWRTEEWALREQVPVLFEMFHED